MRAYSVVSPTVKAEMPPDSVQTMLLAAGAAQAIDWPGAPADARAIEADIVRFTAFSTLGVPMTAMVNVVSTHAVAPTSGSSVTTGTSAGSTGNSIPVQGFRYLQIPGWSTGWSAAAAQAGYLTAEVWHR